MNLRIERSTRQRFTVFTVVSNGIWSLIVDTLDELCFWGSCAAGRGRASPSESPRRNVEPYDQSGRALSPLTQSDARPAAQALRNLLKQSSLSLRIFGQLAVS